jgi:hypothetical protein
MELLTMEVSRLDVVIQLRQAVELLEDALQRRFFDPSPDPLPGSL